MKTLIPIALIVLLSGCGKQPQNSTNESYDGPVSVDIFDISENRTEELDKSSDRWVYVGDRMVIGYLEKGAQRKVDVYFFDENDRLQDQWQIDCEPNKPTQVKKIESTSSYEQEITSIKEVKQSTELTVPDEELINEIVHQLNYSSDPIVTPGNVKDFNWLGEILSV